MSDELGFDLFFPGQYLKAAILVSLLSVWVLVGLFFYLNYYTKRKYFTFWAAGWLFYALWLTLNLSLPLVQSAPWGGMLKSWCVSTVAFFLFWGSARFLGQKIRQVQAGLFMVFLYTWGYYGAYHLEDPLQIRLPVFGLIGLASLRVAWCFWMYRWRRNLIGAGLLAVGFLLWGMFHAGYPFLFLVPELFGSIFFISAVLQLFIAVSMIVLVLEEARQAYSQTSQSLRVKSGETSLLRHRMQLTEQNYRALFEQATEAIVIVSAADLKIMEMNSAASRLLGLQDSPKTVVCLRDVVQGEALADATLTVEGWCLKATGVRLLRLVRKDASVTPIELSGSALDFDGQAAWQFFLRDMTTRDQLETQLRQAEKMSALGQMVSGIAHELNNPLAVIQGYIELILKHHQVSPQTRLDLEKVSQESERASRLVNNFLTFARQQPAQRTVTDINELVRRVVELRKFAIRLAAVDPVLNLDPALPSTLIDVDRMQQVLVVLVNNALQAMMGMGRLGHLWISSRTQGRMVVVTVQDDGPGVPVELEKKIFEPFFTTKPVGTGTGLGLSIAHSILMEHQGRIYHQRMETGGACFVLELPIVSAVAEMDVPVKEAVKVESGEPSKMPVPGKSLRVLVLDDEKVMADLLSEMLQILGHEVTVSTTATQALACLEQHSFEVILSDMRMPGMDGKDFYAEVKNRWPELASRIIFLTGDMVNEETMEFLSSIGNLSVGKPFHIANVNAAFCEVLARHEMLPAATTQSGNDPAVGAFRS